MKLTNCIITDNGITTIIGARPFYVGKDHLNYSKILQTLKSKDGDAFLKLYSIAASIPKLKQNTEFKVSEGLVVGYSSVTWRGITIQSNIVDRLLQLQSEGHDVGPLSRFLEKTLNLPKENAEALFSFMQSKGLPIDNDGDVLGWKVVNSNFKDKYTGKIDNSVGVTVPEIPRSLCDSDNSVACSRGYHVGNMTYSGPSGSFYSSHSGDNIIIVKFNPANVVSVPSDSHENKIRVTQYTVMEQYAIKTQFDKSKMNCSVRNITLDKVKVGNTITFDVPRGFNGVRLKYEGISSRSKNTKFYGRLLKGTLHGEVGRSASFLISEVNNIKVVL